MQVIRHDLYGGGSRSVIRKMSVGGDHKEPFPESLLL